MPLPPLARRLIEIGDSVLVVSTGRQFQIWDVDHVLAHGSPDLVALVHLHQFVQSLSGVVMNLICKLYAHHVVSPAPANQGFQFSRCCRCHTDLMRSDRQDSNKWRAVPKGLRVRWGEIDPSHPMPPWVIVALARRAAAQVRRDVAGIAAVIVAVPVLCHIAWLVLRDSCRALVGRIGGIVSRRGRRPESNSVSRPKRLSLILQLQRNMLHVEVKVARA